jgi:hypothetical protein
MTIDEEVVKMKEIKESFENDVRSRKRSIQKMRDTAYYICGMANLHGMWANANFKNAEYPLNPYMEITTGRFWCKKKVCTIFPIDGGIHCYTDISDGIKIKNDRQLELSEGLHDFIFRVIKYCRAI